MSDSQLQRVAPGCYQVSGKLVFATVLGLLKSSQALFANEPPREIDLSAVTSGDSAGLALLIEWLGVASRSGNAMTFLGTPPQLLALAKIGDLDRVLFADATV